MRHYYGIRLFSSSYFIGSNKEILKTKDRISFDFPQGSRERLEQLQSKSNCATLTELFRRAVSLYEFVIEQQATQSKVVIEQPDGTREVIRIF